jgi:RNA polymerase sigma-32 factor
MNELVKTKALPLIGSFESYKRWVKTIPDLSEEREQELFKLLQNSNNQQTSMESAKELVMSQLKTVVKVAEQHKNYGIPTEDLVQEGNVGLLKAVKNYKPGFSTRLYSYALIWIKSEVQAYILKNWKIVKAATTNNLKKLFFNFKSTQNQLINEGVENKDLIKEIAKKLNVSEDEAREMQSYMLGHDSSLSIEKSDSKDSSDNVVVLEIPDYSTPETVYLEKKSQEDVSKALSNALSLLNEKQRKVIELRYYNDEKMTHKEIAPILGVSAERVRQLELEALSKMKSKMMPLEV